jgi:hypothetical protein
VVIYLATPSTKAIRDAMTSGYLGCIATPKQGNRIPGGVLWAADNGCGPGQDGAAGRGFPGYARYLAWLQDLVAAERADPCDPDQSGCLFAVAPDVIADAAATLKREDVFRMLHWIRHIGPRAA